MFSGKGKCAPCYLSSVFHLLSLGRGRAILQVAQLFRFYPGIHPSLVQDSEVVQGGGLLATRLPEMCVKLQPDSIVTNRHHKIKSQSLTHIIKFLLESGCKKEVFEMLAELRLKVENCICGSFKRDYCSASIVPVLLSQHITWVHLKTVAFQGGRGGGKG